MKDDWIIKRAKEYGIEDSHKNMDFVLSLQETFDSQMKLHSDNYNKLVNLHFSQGGRLPYHINHPDAQFLNCLRLDYQEYKDGVISFFQLLKALWFHAWRIRDIRQTEETQHS